jgi:hypothetical protein
MIGGPRAVVVEKGEGRHLRDALKRIWRRPGDQFGEPSQVLGDSGQNKLILGASRAAQSKPVEPQDALEVCKPHLDFLALCVPKT